MDYQEGTKPQDTPSTHFNPHEVKTLLSWEAPGRPFQKRTKQYFLTVLLLAFFVEIILFLFGEYMLMAVVVSLVFVTFVLAIVPPHMFSYKITSEGLMTGDHFYLWQELYDFHFKKRLDTDLLHVGTLAFYPGEIIIPLTTVDVEHVKAVLLPYLPFREYVKPTFTEKSAKWLTATFPLETKKTTSPTSSV